MNDELKKAVKIFKALGDKTRLRILKILQKKQGACVCEIQYILNTSQSVTSRHLRVLEDAGLIYQERNGKWTDYYIEKSEENDIVYAVESLISTILEEDPQIKKDAKMIINARRDILCK